MSKLKVFIVACIICGSFIFILLKFNSSPVLKVGEYEFTRDDISKADIVERLKYPYLKKNLGKKTLKKAAIYAVLLKRLGQPVTKEQLSLELKRINRSTMRPQKWKELKNLFKERDQLLKVLILPIYVQQKLSFSIFPYNRRVHEKSYQRAKSFFLKAQTEPSAWEKYSPHFLCLWWSASQNRYFETETCYEKAQKNKSQVIDKSPLSQESMAWKKRIFKNKEDYTDLMSYQWVQRWLKDLKPGLVLKQIIELPQSFLVVRLDQFKKNSSHKIKLAKFSMVIFEKPSFQEWLEQEKKTIVIQE